MEVFECGRRGTMEYCLPSMSSIYLWGTWRISYHDLKRPQRRNLYYLHWLSHVEIGLQAPWVDKHCTMPTPQHDYSVRSPVNLYLIFFICIFSFWFFLLISPSALLGPRHHTQLWPTKQPWGSLSSTQNMQETSSNHKWRKQRKQGDMSFQKLFHLNFKIFWDIIARP